MHFCWKLNHCWWVGVPLPLCLWIVKRVQMVTLVLLSFDIYSPWCLQLNIPLLWNTLTTTILLSMSSVTLWPCVTPHRGQFTRSLVPIAHPLRAPVMQHGRQILKYWLFSYQLLSSALEIQLLLCCISGISDIPPREIGFPVENIFPFTLQSGVWAANPDSAQCYEYAGQDISSSIFPQLDHHLRYFQVQGDKFNIEAMFAGPKLSFLARRNLASHLDAS